jgi:hypothetical protein
MYYMQGASNTDQVCFQGEAPQPLSWTITGGISNVNPQGWGVSVTGWTTGKCSGPSGQTQANLTIFPASNAATGNYTFSGTFPISGSASAYVNGYAFTVVAAPQGVLVGGGGAAC